MAIDASQLFARLAVGMGLLSAVADRFGLWGPHGAHNVAWGSFSQFTLYTGSVNRFFPAALAPFVAVASTVFETAFGIGLVLGIRTRWIATGSGVLLGLFALAIRYRWSLDEAFGRKEITALR